MHRISFLILLISFCLTPSLYSEEALPSINLPMGPDPTVSPDQKPQDIPVTPSERKILSEKLRKANIDPIKMTLPELEHYFERGMKGIFQISGEVDTMWIYQSETIGSRQHRGGDSPEGLGANSFKTEVLVSFDYAKNNAFASMELDWFNLIGENNARVTQITLPRAFMAYSLFEWTSMDAIIYLGRRQLLEFYDSEIQFESIGTGATFSYGYGFPHDTNIAIDLGGYFVTPSTLSNRFVFIVEAGCYQILKSSFYIDYTFTEWGQFNFNGQYTRTHPQWQYMISQILLGYFLFQDNPTWAGKIVGGFLINTRAQKVKRTRYQKENLGWYVDLQIGKIKKQNDFAFEAMWQVVQAQTIPDFDLSGLGHGNAPGFSLFQTNNPAFALGAENYNSWILQFLYAISDNLTLRFEFDRALPYTRSFGPPFAYTLFQMASLYTF